MSVCVACYKEGKCNGLCGRPKTRAKPRRAAVKRAMIERGAEPYIHLRCGHLTTREAQLAFSAWKPKGKDHYCEQCGHWMEKLPKPKPEPLPEEPLF